MPSLRPSNMMCKDSKEGTTSETEGEMVVVATLVSGAAVAVLLLVEDDKERGGDCAN